MHRSSSRSPRHVLRLATLTVVTVLGCIGGAAGLGAQDEEHPVTLDVLPTACLDPCSVRTRAWIVPDEDNRWLGLSAESAAYYRRSVIELEGADAARSYSMVFRDLPAGTYVINATVERTDGATITVTRDVTVRGPKGE